MEAVLERKIDMHKSRVAEFFKKEQKQLVNFVKKLINDSSELDGEDIVQDVMLKIFEKGDVLEPIENISAYIYHSIRNKVIDTFRTRKENASLEDEILAENNLKLSDILHDMRYDTVSEVEKNEINNNLYNCIDSLKNDEKAIIIETEFEQKTFRELSEAWDTPIGTLLARKSRALVKIREMLEDIIN